MNFAWDFPLLAPEVSEPPASPVSFQVRVALNDTHPPVWRRLLVPGPMGLHEFHLLL